MSIDKARDRIEEILQAQHQYTGEQKRAIASYRQTIASEADSKAKHFIKVQNLQAKLDAGETTVIDELNREQALFDGADALYQSAREGIKQIEAEVRAQYAHSFTGRTEGAEAALYADAREVLNAATKESFEKIQSSTMNAIKQMEEYHRQGGKEELDEYKKVMRPYKQKARANRKTYIAYLTEVMGLYLFAATELDGQTQTQELSGITAETLVLQRGPIYNNVLEMIEERARELYPDAPKKPRKYKTVQAETPPAGYAHQLNTPYLHYLNTVVSFTTPPVKGDSDGSQGEQLYKQAVMNYASAHGFGLKTIGGGATLEISETEKIEFPFRASSTKQINGINRFNCFVLTLIGRRETDSFGRTILRIPYAEHRTIMGQQQRSLKNFLIGLEKQIKDMTIPYVITTEDGKQKTGVGWLITNLEYDAREYVLVLNSALWEALLAGDHYYTMFPQYGFRLKGRAFNLMYYIFYLARQRGKEIKENGYFSISLKTLQVQLGLPDMESLRGDKNAMAKTIGEIEKAVNKIMELFKAAGNTDIKLALDYTGATAAQRLETGRLLVYMKGEVAETFVKLEDKKTKYRLAAKTNTGKQKRKKS